MSWALCFHMQCDFLFVQGFFWDKKLAFSTSLDKTKPWLIAWEKQPATASMRSRISSGFTRFFLEAPPFSEMQAHSNWNSALASPLFISGNCPGATSPAPDMVCLPLWSHSSLWLTLLTEPVAVPLPALVLLVAVSPGYSLVSPCLLKLFSPAM